MAKFKLKSSSVYLGGIVYKAKKEPTIFDIDGKFKNLKTEVLAAEKAGFLIKIIDKGKNQIKSEKKQVDKK